MKTNLKSFISEIQNEMNPADCHWTDTIAIHTSKNTLGFKAQSLGLLFPRNVEQLKNILKVAKTNRIPIHTVSQGKNIGYGEMTPAQNDQVVVNLCHLNQISNYDATSGTIVVGPGVTQKQLSDFLRNNGDKHWADMTGASPEASIVGNTIEAGFGHTPLGDHRKHILAMDVLLYDGQELKTLEMPAPGPDLSQLFVQTNFAIVTSLTIPLLRVPEVALTYTISFDSDNELFSGLEILREMQSAGVIESLVHIGNSTRSLMTSFPFPSDINKEITISESESRQILKKRLGVDTGAWTAVGCLYGFKAEVNEKASHLKRSFKGKAKLRFFSDRKMKFMSALLSLKPLAKFQKIKWINRSISTLRAIHEIMRGVPSAVPSSNILWRAHSAENNGLIWHSPVVPNSPEEIKILLDNHRQIFASFGFEMPVTLTMINPRKMVAVFNLNFDRSNPYDVKRAHIAYLKLGEAAKECGHQPYRYSLLGQPLGSADSCRSRILLGLKRFFDPHNLLAPGRYGLTLNSQSNSEVGPGIEPN